jgi:hypothetical protein
MCEISRETGTNAKLGRKKGVHQKGTEGIKLRPVGCPTAKRGQVHLQPFELLRGGR